MDNWKEVIQQAYTHAKQQGLTQTQIAEKIGCTQKKISTLVNGKYQPLLGFALKFIESCGMDIEVKEKQFKNKSYDTI
jgi:predicted XRE-type DNA-binding protein